MQRLVLKNALARIELQAVLQQLGWTRSGGEAKCLIQAGEIRVNGAVERRRSHQLGCGDRVLWGVEEAVLVSDDH